MTSVTIPRDAQAKQPWHEMPVQDCLTALQASPSGLAKADIPARVTRYGLNELAEAESVRPWAILGRQFASLIVWLLLVAAAVSGFLGEWIDAGAIAFIVVLNAVVGFFQEYRAERAMAALRSMAAPHARVRRGGAVHDIASREVVPGDILVLEAGDLVAADARLLRSESLACGEAALTGESVPVDKRAEATVGRDAPLGDRTNLVFFGTAVSGGSGEAVVVATGMATELGAIAGLIRSTDSGDTPLQRRLAAFGKVLVAVSLGLVGLLFLLGLARGIPSVELFLISVSLAVAAVPEGLAAVVTVALALGVQRMTRRRALVRRLAAVETLGSTSVICTDKTGTLTMNAMTVRTLQVAGLRYEVTGEGYAPTGTIHLQAASAAANTAALDALLLIAGGCNAASLRQEAGEWIAIGDPTDAALLTVAAKGGWTQERIEREHGKVGERPFDGDRKRVTVIRRHGPALRALVKGAPDMLLACCTRLMTDGGERPMTSVDRAAIAVINGELADSGLRVLGAAQRDLPDAVLGDAASVERDLTWVGLFGMQDPPRPQATDAVARCRSAGIQVVMITGDHPRTALAIARLIGIADAGAQALSGVELDALDDAALAARVKTTPVYARVTAAHKLRSVRAGTAHGAVVAMTGDGVNDAPAIKGADIGIAMGKSGTEVTKEAAAMIILDDDFATIVAAVEEGRGIYDNIRKTIEYLLAGNAGELLLMGVCIVAGLPIPLLPVHLLWINLVTDGLPALCLATDPIDRSLMTQPPRPAREGLTKGSALIRIGVTGVLSAGVAFAVYLHGLQNGDLESARTQAFATLVFCELFRAFGARSDTRMLWEVGFLTNLRLLAVVVVSVVLQIVSHQVEWLGRLLRTNSMPLSESLMLVAFGLVPLVVLEVWKGLARWRAKRTTVAPTRVG